MELKTDCKEDDVEATDTDAKPDLETRATAKQRNTNVGRSTGVPL